jgi:hypothetical protein
MHSRPVPREQKTARRSEALPAPAVYIRRVTAVRYTRRAAAARRRGGGGRRRAAAVYVYRTAVRARTNIARTRGY